MIHANGEIPSVVSGSIEQSSPPFDFTEALQHAAQQAPIIDPTDEKSGNRESRSQFSAFFEHRSDTAIGYVNTYKREPHTVLTDTADKYTYLIEQASRMFHAEDFPDDKTLATAVEQTVTHEEEHWTVARMVGLHAPARYGIGLARYQQDNGQLKPGIARAFIQASGCLRKIDWAFIVAAPSDPSQSDLQFIHDLGYESPEEVQERRANLPTGHFAKPELMRLGARVIDWWIQPLWQQH